MMGGGVKVTPIEIIRKIITKVKMEAVMHWIYLVIVGNRVIIIWLNRKRNHSNHKIRKKMSFLDYLDFESFYRILYQYIK